MPIYADGLATVYAVWGIPKPHNVSNMFGSWLINGIPKESKCLVLMGAAALCWSVWLCINTVIFRTNNLRFFAGYLLDYALAPLMGYPSMAYYTEGAWSGISFFGADGQELFCPDISVAF